MLHNQRHNGMNLGQRSVKNTMKQSLTKMLKKSLVVILDGFRIRDGF